MDLGEVSSEDYFTRITENTQTLSQVIQVIHQTKAYFDDQINKCSDANLSELIALCKQYALTHCNETANVIGDIGIDLSCLLAYQASRVQNISLRLSSIQSKMISHEQKIAVDYSREITYLRSYIPRRLKLQRITDPVLPPGLSLNMPEYDHTPLNLSSLSTASADDDWMPVQHTRDHSYSVAPHLQKSTLTPSRAKDDWRSKVAYVDPTAATTTKRGQDMSFFHSTPTGSNVQSYTPTASTTHTVPTFQAPTVNFAAPEPEKPTQTTLPAAPILKLSDLKGKPSGPSIQTPSTTTPSNPPPPSAPMPPTPSSTTSGSLGPPPPRQPAAPQPPSQQPEQQYNDYQDYTNNNNDYNDYSHIQPPPPQQPAAPQPPPPQEQLHHDSNFDAFSAIAPPPPPSSGTYEAYEVETLSVATSNFDAFSAEAPPPPPSSDELRTQTLYEEPEQQYHQSYDYNQSYEQPVQQQEEEQPAAEEEVNGYYDEQGNWWYMDYDGQYKMWIPPDQ